MRLKTGVESSELDERGGSSVNKSSSEFLSAPGAVGLEEIGCSGPAK